MSEPLDKVEDRQPLESGASILPLPKGNPTHSCQGQGARAHVVWSRGRNRFAGR
jgi:hypothetical protein